MNLVSIVSVFHIAKKFGGSSNFKKSFFHFGICHDHWGKLQILHMTNDIVPYPIVIYDNLCTSCTSYAKLVNQLLRGKVVMLGHYTLRGKKFKETIFPKNYDGTDMSWFVTETRAYGGRECLKELIKYGILTIRKSNDKEFPKNRFMFDECATDCKTVKNVIIRSCSIITNGKIIEFSKQSL